MRSGTSAEWSGVTMPNDDLPPLPESIHLYHDAVAGLSEYLFTADQMRAYARAARPDTAGLVWALHVMDDEHGRIVHMVWDTPEQAKAFVQWCQARIGTLDGEGQQK